ncbi:MAG TPA: hypothetical protein VNH11_21245 [Pirellulales bacterium]|nr:hypothetical protein [Pirellulales bacterium]
MPLPGEHETIADDEVLYRRVPVSTGWVKSVDEVLPEAFQPRRDDTTGLSVFRAKFRKLDETARGASKHGYYVLELRAGDLRAAGIEIVPKPDDDAPGHAEIPSLAFGEPETNDSLKHRQLLAEQLICAVHGPFPPAKH